MQTDLLLKQVATSLADLKIAIDKFEKHAAPSTQYAEQLYNSITAANKLVSAYVILKEQKDVSPELDLHLKIMTSEELKQEPAKEIIKEEIKVEKAPIIEPVQEIKPVETIAEKIVAQPVITPEAIKPIENIITPTSQPIVKSISNIELPKINVSINDKFRFINDLFASNANEYTIAIEQLNTIHSKEDAAAYLKGLQSIYNWDDENEMVKKLFSLTQKRFS